MTGSSPVRASTQRSAVSADCPQSLCGCVWQCLPGAVGALVAAWQAFNRAVHPVQEGRNYLAAMSCAANYAWVNRSSMTFLVRQAFQKMFKQQADDLDMHVVYDVSHNIAKVHPLRGGQLQRHLTTLHFHSHAC